MSENECAFIDDGAVVAYHCCHGTGDSEDLHTSLESEDFLKDIEADILAATNSA